MTEQYDKPPAWQFWALLVVAVIALGLPILANLGRL